MRGDHMHAIVFRVKIHDQERATEILQQHIVPAVSRAPGFVAGYWVGAAEGAGTSVIVFETEEDATRATSGPQPQSDALSVESVTIGPVVAHA
jgi:hypothetical protein